MNRHFTREDVRLAGKHMKGAQRQQPLVLSRVRLCDPLPQWNAALVVSLPFTLSQSLLQLMSIERMILSNHLILCCSLGLLLSTFPSIRDFSNEYTMLACRGGNIFIPLSAWLQGPQMFSQYIPRVPFSSWPDLGERPLPSWTEAATFPRIVYRELAGLWAEGPGFLDTSSMSGCRICKQTEAVGQGWVWDCGDFGLV